MTYRVRQQLSEIAKPPFDPNVDNEYVLADLEFIMEGNSSS